MSSIFSVPIESLIVFGLIPWSNSSSSVHWLCVVVAGWITSDLTSATFARSEKSSKLSIKSFAFCASPLISNVKIDPSTVREVFLVKFPLLWICGYRWVIYMLLPVDGCSSILQLSVHSVHDALHEVKVSQVPVRTGMNGMVKLLHLYHEAGLHGSL